MGGQKAQTSRLDGGGRPSIRRCSRSSGDSSASSTGLSELYEQSRRLKIVRHVVTSVDGRLLFGRSTAPLGINPDLLYRRDAEIEARSVDRGAGRDRNIRGYRCFGRPSASAIDEQSLTYASQPS